jgi:hypothetical protein
VIFRLLSAHDLISRIHSLIGLTIFQLLTMPVTLFAGTSSVLCVTQCSTFMTEAAA